MTLRPEEARQLRALIADAWPHRGTPELREHAERIVEWDDLRALTTIDLRAMRTAALEAVEAELARRTSIDELVALLRRTAPPANRPQWPFSQRREAAA